MAAMNSTKSGHHGQCRADVSIRLAEQRDWRAILDIDATGGAYDEGDYLHGKLAAYLTDKNRFCYVGEVDGKVVSFFLARAVDGGRNMVGRLARVDRKLRGRGLWDTTRYLTMADYVKRNPEVNGYIGCVSDLEALQKTMPTDNRFNVLLKRSMFSVSAPRTSIFHVPKEDPGNCLEPLTFHLCDELLNDTRRSRRLYPHDIVVVGREPLYISKQNMPLIFEECKVILASNTTSGETTTVSFGTAFDSPQGHVWEVDINTSSVDNPADLASHVITHLKSAQSCFPDEIIKLIVFIWPACRKDAIFKGLRPLVDTGSVKLGHTSDHFTAYINCDLYLAYLTSKI